MHIDNTWPGGRQTSRMRFHLLFAALLALPFSAKADIAVYGGTVATHEISETETDRAAVRVLQVIDLANGDSVTFVLERHGAQLTFDVHPVESHVITRVGDAKGRGHDFTVIGKAVSSVN